MDDPRSFSLKPVAGELRLLFTNRLAQDEGETAGAENGYEVGAGTGSTRSSWARVRMSK